MGTLRWGAACVALLLAAPTLAQTRAVATVDVDLPRLIERARGSPAQFAVPVPHTADSATTGRWTTDGATRTWRYSVRVPGAVSMSLNARAVGLHADAALTINGTTVRTRYTAAEIGVGDFYSRIVPGDTLDVTLVVSTANPEARLTIEGLQAGYRSLGAGVRNHASFDRAYAQAASAEANDACVLNYLCETTAGNTPAGRATVGIVVANLYQCTGTLVNTAADDGTPYVLTARHCQNGEFGGGNPGNAASVRIYYNALSACGAALGSLYDPGTLTQSGGTTVVEQQDAWLIRLDASPPVGSNAHLVGIDVRGADVDGGYSIHHALGNTKQFTAWSGRAFRSQESNVLGATYVSDFLQTVNARGTFGPGASGSALFDSTDRVVGVMSLGRAPDVTGYAACPSAPPAAPNGSNAAAYFTALSAVWASTADTSASTGSTTLRSVLDPGNTGAQTTVTVPATYLTFTASAAAAGGGRTVRLTWDAPGATACTPTGGTAGDGWTGALPASGTRDVTSTVADVIVYRLSCQGANNRRAFGRVAIQWGVDTPQFSLNAPTVVWVGRPARLSWSSTATSCRITGGSTNLTGLPPTGETSVTESATTTVEYILVCDGTLTARSVQFITPTVMFRANGTDRQLGQPFFLRWQSYGDACTPAGGAPGDGWTNVSFRNPGEIAEFSPIVTTAGTYTYRLTCASGPVSVSREIVVRFSNDPGYAELSVDRTSATYANSPDYRFTFSYKTNLNTCWQAGDIVSSIGDTGFAEGTFIVSPQPGTYRIRLQCNPYNTVQGAALSNIVEITVLPPATPTATLTVSPSAVAVGTPVTVTWASTNTMNCSSSGGFTNSIWGSGMPSGTAQLTPTVAGQFTFAIACQPILPSLPTATAQASVTVTALPPTVTLQAAAAQVTRGQSLQLTWSSSNTTGCTASGGGANGSPWTGTLATAGTLTQTTTVSGTFTYTVTCTSPGQSAQAQTTIVVSEPAPPPAPPGGGGGGRTDWLTLLALGLLVPLRRRYYREGIREPQIEISSRPERPAS